MESGWKAKKKRNTDGSQAKIRTGKSCSQRRKKGIHGGEQTGNWETNAANLWKKADKAQQSEGGIKRQACQNCYKKGRTTHATDSWKKITCRAIKTKLHLKH